jgi:hypothetical protein
MSNKSSNESLITTSVPLVQTCSAKEVISMNPYPETLPTNIEENRSRVQADVHSSNSHKHNHHSISN